MKRLLCLVFSGFFLASLAQAVAGDDVDAVTIKDKNIYALHGAKSEVLTTDLTFPNQVVISTNGTFKVGKGKDRALLAGQILRRDGWLVGADGSVQPVIDHVGMKQGRVYVVRDGKATDLQSTLQFPNGMSLDPNGYGTGLPAGRNRILDGQLFNLDGSAIQGKDTVTLKNGQVIVQKDGTLLPLTSAQIMGMSDGTRVYGSGTIQKPDGTTFQLREGQTILIDGAYYGR